MTQVPTFPGCPMVSVRPCEGKAKLMASRIDVSCFEKVIRGSSSTLSKLPPARLSSKRKM